MSQKAMHVPISAYLVHSSLALWNHTEFTGQPNRAHLQAEAPQLTGCATVIIAIFMNISALSLPYVSIFCMYPESIQSLKHSYIYIKRPILVLLKTHTRGSEHTFPVQWAVTTPAPRSHSGAKYVA